MKPRLVLNVAIWLVFLSLVSLTVAASRPPSDAKCPSAVSLVTESGDSFTYSIQGLYGDASKWSKFSNRVARMFEQFSATDSLVVDLQSGRAYLTTLRSHAELGELVDWLAQFTGYVPTWEELQARDSRSDSFERSRYKLLCHYETRAIRYGYWHCGTSVTDSGTVELHFYDNPQPPGTVGSYLLQIGWNNGTGPAVSFTLADSLSRADMYQLDGYTEPLQSLLVMSPGAEGVVRLNKATAHCKGEMRYSLRVYEAAGKSIWVAEEEIYGRCGVWAVDLNGDGEDEVVVMAHEHGRVHVFVYGV